MLRSLATIALYVPPAQREREEQDKKQEAERKKRKERRRSQRRRWVRAQRMRQRAGGTSADRVGCVQRIRYMLLRACKEGKDFGPYLPFACKSDMWGA